MSLKPLPAPTPAGGVGVDVVGHVAHGVVEDDVARQRRLAR